MSAAGLSVFEQYPNFQPQHTGGGCMAMEHPLEDGGYILVTDTDGCGIPTKDDTAVIVGCYDAKGHVVGGDDNTPEIPVSELKDWIDAQLVQKY